MELLVFILLKLYCDAQDGWAFVMAVMNLWFPQQQEIEHAGSQAIFTRFKFCTVTLTVHW
jgi:hypothetical protein